MSPENAGGVRKSPENGDCGRKPPGGGEAIGSRPATRAVSGSRPAALAMSKTRPTTEGASKTRLEAQPAPGSRPATRAKCHYQRYVKCEIARIFMRRARKHPAASAGACRIFIKPASETLFSPYARLTHFRSSAAYDASCRAHRQGPWPRGATACGVMPGYRPQRRARHAEHAATSLEPMRFRRRRKREESHDNYGF